MTLSLWPQHLSSCGPAHGWRVTDGLCHSGDGTPGRVSFRVRLCLALTTRTERMRFTRVRALHAVHYVHTKHIGSMRSRRTRIKRTHP